MRLRLALVWLGAFSLVLSVASVARADTDQKQIDSLKKQIEVLSQRVQELEQQAPASSSALETRVRELEGRMSERAADESPFMAGWKDGFCLQSSDGKTMLKLGGYIQMDGVWEAGGGSTRTNPPAPNDGFVMKRVRLIASGKMYTYYDFYVETAWDYGSASLKDAYLNVTYFDPVNVQVGLFKAPLSAEYRQDARNLELMERSLMNNLMPMRDVGVMFHGYPAKKLEYALGYLNGVNGQGTDLDDEKDVMGRVLLTPFGGMENEWLEGLGIGAFGSWGRQERVPTAAEPAGAYYTVSGLRFFDWNGDTELTGARLRYGVTGMLYTGPFHIMSEWMKMRENVSAPAAGLADRGFTTEAWYVQAGMVLTGEKASYTGVKPSNPFDPREGKFGAFEAVLRYSNINIEQNAVAQGYAEGATTADEYAGGVNWYLNDAVKCTLMYAHTYLKSANDEDAIMFRFQVAF